jgi:iron complex outermembrane recepter protein
MKKISFLLIALLIICVWAKGQKISGNIYTKQNEPLSGATITFKNSYFGTTSNQDGYFEIDLPKNPNPILEVRYIGFKSFFQELETGKNYKLFNITLEADAIEKAEFIVVGTRANNNTPAAYSNINKETLEKQNLGQDIPFLLNLTPSVLVSSDAGAGVGYTDMRIRGTDVTRINVTVNGIPLNDSESQGVFWVNMPDFSSSLNSIQIQRGVGTSTNGASAFGASVNLETENNQNEAYGETNISYGSFNTQKYNLQFGTGLLKNKWAFDGRLSSITSDGYIDRAKSDLKSYYLTGGYYGDKTTFKLVHFSGRENTYQAWYGTPEPAITNNQNDKLDYVSTEGLNQEQTENLLQSGRTYNHYLYDNEVDNYKQDHYQAHLTQNFSSNLTGNLSFHYTKGQGYFEQFRDDDDFSDYGLQNPIIGGDTLTSTNLVRRRWLDNDFYGFVYGLNYQKNKLNLNFGGAANWYEGDHFGEIIWSEIAIDNEIDFRYYDNVGQKSGVNVYLKSNYQISKKINLFGDLQYRNVDYKTSGVDNDLRTISIDETFNFINPKAGLTYFINNKNKAYFSVAVANREPSRTDYLDAALTQPEPETLIDYEFGIERNVSKYRSALNLFYMDYNNQLIATGELNDVGALVKTNVAESFRAGAEIQLAYQITPKLKWEANYTYSINQISNFDEVLYDYTNGFDIVVNNYKNTTMALSPSNLAKSIITFAPVKQLEASWITSFASEQYLDNTSNENRKIDGFITHDLRLNYNQSIFKLQNFGVSLLVNNIFSELYSTRGYTYSYIYGDLITRNHFYPQATRNFLVAVNLKF